MKLQKLAYYAQAWHLARRGRPLFEDRIEAWTNGPVVRSLYDAHREDPWRKARQGMPDSARSTALIKRAAMRRFYRDEQNRRRTPAFVTAAG